MSRCDHPVTCWLPRVRPWLRHTGADRRQRGVLQVCRHGSGGFRLRACAAKGALRYTNLAPPGQQLIPAVRVKEDDVIGTMSSTKKIGDLQPLQDRILIKVLSPCELLPLTLLEPLAGYHNRPCRIHTTHCRPSHRCRGTLLQCRVPTQLVSEVSLFISTVSQSVSHIVATAQCAIGLGSAGRVFSLFVPRPSSRSATNIVILYIIPSAAYIQCPVQQCCH